VKRDAATNHSKGYGFIRFVNFQAQIQCLSQQRHFIGSRWCEVRIPSSKVLCVFILWCFIYRSLASRVVFLFCIFGIVTAGLEAGMQNALFMPPSQQCQCAGRTLVYGDSEKNKPLYMYLIDIQTYVDRHIWDVQKLNLFSITSLRCALVRCREAAHVHKSSVIWAICRAALFQH